MKELFARKKRFLLYLFTMLLLLFWLFSSNLIIANLSGATVPQKIYDTEQLIKDNVYYGIDTIQTINNLTEWMSVSGWAFVETKNEITNKQVSLVLKKENISYQADCNLFPRSGLREILSDSLKTDIQENILGFSVDISTIMMEDGIYDLYIYCKENEENYGMANADYGGSDVGIQVEKRGSKLECYAWKSKSQNDLLQITQEELAVGAVDSAEIVDDRLNIWGWVFVQNKNCDSQNVYLELINDEGQICQYETKSAIRTAVVSEYHNEQYKNCGYRTSIPLGNLPDGQYKMRVLVENNEEIWTTEIYLLIINGSEVNLQKHITPLEDFQFNGSIFRDDVYYGIDTISAIDDSSDIFQIVGWAFVETAENNTDKEISVVLHNNSFSYQAKCLLFIKSNLQNSFPNAKIQSNMNAFSANINVAQMEDGIYDLYIYCRENEVNYGISNLDYGASSVGIQIEKSGRDYSLYQWKSKILDQPLVVSQEDNLVGAIDSIKIEGERLNIWGWAFVPEQDCQSQKVYLELIGEQGSIKQFTTQTAMRDGVVREYGNDKYRNSGYRTSIPIDSIPEEKYRIKIILENGGRVWSSMEYLFDKMEGLQ